MAVNMATIKKGNKGEDVCFARRLLKAYGAADLAEKELYDEEMQQAVQTFKKYCGLAPNDLIDASVWSCLAPVLNRDTNCCNRVKAIKLVQGYLRSLGFIYFVPDGIYGAGTQSAVSAFQQAMGLKVDGIWGRECWNHWFKGVACRECPTPALAY